MHNKGYNARARFSVTQLFRYSQSPRILRIRKKGLENSFLDFAEIVNLETLTPNHKNAPAYSRVVVENDHTMKTFLTYLFIGFIFYGFSQSPVDSTVYHYYNNTAGVHRVFYNIKHYSNGNIKEHGWIVSIDEDHDLADVPDDFDNMTIHIEVGVYKRYFENGKISSIRTVNLNKTDSISFKQFLPNGLTDYEWIFPHQKKCNYPKKKFKGPFTYYQKNFENGILYNEGLWVVGLYSVGKWIWYNKDGSIKGAIDYGNGGAKIYRKKKNERNKLNK